MKILFVRNVTRQGSVGEVKEVANGFAQFLIGKGDAVLATDSVVVQNKKKIDEQLLRSKGEESYAFDVAKKLEGKVMRIKGGANNKGSLYRALHKKDILDLLSKEIVVTIPDTLISDVSIKRTGTNDILMSYKGKKLGSFSLLIE